MVRKISRGLKTAEHTLWYEKPAENFNETLPLGNGRIGACLYGRTGEEIISLNEDTLWSGYPKDIVREDFPGIYKKAYDLCQEGRFMQAQQLVENRFGDYLVQMYLPLGCIRIRNADSREISGYRRELLLDEALHRVSWQSGDRDYVREAFVSCDAQVLVIHSSCSEPGCISFTARMESQLKCCFSKASEGICMEGCAPAAEAVYGKAYTSADCLVYGQDPAHRGMGFAAVLWAEVSGGSAVVSEDGITVKDADEVTLYVAVRTAFERWDRHPSYSCIDYKALCFSDIKKAGSRSFGEWKRRNILAHKKLYDRCFLSLGSGRNSGLPTDRRLALHAQGEKDNALYALLFHYGRYLAIASSAEGTQPTNLQGIWNEKLLPPWNCNYTLNINTEMNYWPLLACGLPECYEPFVKMAQELARSGERTAKVYYGAEGWVCHHSTDLWRLTHPGTNRLPGSAQWGFFNMSSGWIGVMLWNYYRYTKDKAYLEKIYPVLEGAGLFYRQLLTRQDGKLVLSPSTSPENNYIQDGEVHALDISSAMTQEILYDLFSALSQAQEILGFENQYADRVHELKKPLIQNDGLLCEWNEEHGIWDPHHRHVSHLYGLFPSGQFDEERKTAARKTLEQRGEGGTGWSLAWKINLWARLGDGAKALKLLDNQLKLVPSSCDSPDRPGGSYPNLLCAHPPFQIDGNFGAVSGIIEMLVQVDENDQPILLPALPGEWKEGRAEGIRLPGGKKISFSWKDRQVTEMELTDV